MKTILKTISASLAIACVFTFQTPVRIYAADKNFAQASSASDAVLKERKKIDLKYDYQLAKLVDDDGNIYYSVYDVIGYGSVSNIKIIKTDSTGKILASADGRGDVFKQIDDKIYVLCENFGEDFKTKITSVTCKVYDSELKLENEYSFSNVKSCQYADVNSDKVCYIKGKKIYISKLNGKNKKLLADMNKTELKDTFIQGIALTRDHVGFIAEKYEKGKRKTYCGVISLKTGKIKYEEQPMLWIPKSFNDRLAWNSNNSGTVSISSSSKQIVIYDGSKFSQVKTQTSDEALNNVLVDSEGRIITHGYKNGRGYFRIYKDGKAVKTLEFEGSFVTAAANNGIIAYSSTEYKNGKNYVKTELIPY